MAKKGNPLQNIITNFLNAEWILQNLGFLSFLAVLALLYIFNAHYSEKRVREIQATEKEMKELRWQYTSLRAQVMYHSMQSEIADDVEAAGLKNREARVKKIIVD